MKKWTLFFTYLQLIERLGPLVQRFRFRCHFESLKLREFLKTRKFIKFRGKY